MNRILLFFACFIATIQIYGQDLDKNKVNQDAKKVKDILKETPVAPWTFGASFQVQINQSFNMNWKGASAPSVGSAALANMFLRYQKNKFAWENTLDINYAFRVSFNKLYGDPNKKVKSRFEKVTDVLDFKSKVGLQAKGYWFYGAMFTLNTQMTKGYDASNDTVMTSTFMTPGNITLSIGMDYKRTKWSWYISPIGAKMITKTHKTFFPTENFGVLANKKLYMAIGASTYIVFNSDIHKKVNLNTKLEMFYDYLGEYKQMRNIDVRFDMTWMFSVTDWLSISLYAALLYDYNVKFDCYDQNGVIRQYLAADGTLVNLQTDHLQFQEAFGLTLGYKFKLPKVSK